MTGRLLISILLLAMAGPASLAQDADLAQIKERELERVREKISDLKESMDKQAAERDRVTGELQTAEGRIAEKRQRLKDLERQRDYSEQKKAELEAQLRVRRAALATETDQLAIIRPRLSRDNRHLATIAMLDGLRIGGAATALEVLLSILEPAS